MLLTERELCPSIQASELVSAPLPPQIPWRVINVKPHHEQSVAQFLKEQGYELYLPTYRSVRKWHDRKVTLDLPLFPSYAFLRFNIAERARILATSGVRSILSFSREPAEVSEEEISTIRQLLASGLPVAPALVPLQIGRKIKITDGPLTGVEGILQKFKGVCELIVVAEILRRAVKVTIDREWVEGIR